MLNKYLSYKLLLKQMLSQPVAVIMAVSVITLFFAFNLPRLSFKTSVHDFVIEDLSETARYQDFKKIFGSDEIIRVVIKTENVFEPATFSKIEQFAENASEIKGIRRVISLPGIKKEVDISNKWNMDNFTEMLAPVDLFSKNIISDDRKTTAITLILNNDADTETIIRAVSKMMSETSKELSLYQIGMPLVSKALASFTKKDFFRLPPLTFLLIAGVLFFLFRNLPCFLLPLTCVATSLVWTFGMMAVTGTPLAMLTMIVPIFIIAVGTAYCLYICSEYLSCARHAESPRDAVFTTFSNMALPTFLAVLTTSTGLGSLLVNRISAIHEFAIFSCFGITSLLIIVLTLFPCALTLIPLPEQGQQKQTPGSGHQTTTSGLTDRFLDIIIHLSLKHQRITLMVIGLIVVFCLIGMLRLRAETNPVGYFKKDTQISRNFHDIYKDLSGSFPINVAMDSRIESYFEDPEHVRQISRLQKFLETLPGVDKTVSFADYMKLVNYALNKFDPKYYALPEESFEVRMVLNNYRSMLGEDMLSQFMNQEFSKVNILLLTHISSSRDFLETQEKILEHVNQNFSEDIAWDVTGFGMVISASSHILVSGQVKSLSLTMAIIFSIMFVLFLSTRVGLVAIVSACFPIIINFGLMGWAGIRLSVATSLIASIAIGLAVDDIIHYLVRYSREFKKDLDKDRALRDTIKSVGRPIIFTSLTISIGFSILIFSHFKPTSVFGILMVITMFSALAGDLLILPSLMLHVELVTAWDLLRLMPTLGGMSAGIAHELNQPLTVIKMGSDILKMITTQDKEIPKEQLRQVVSEISEQVDRASEMVSRLKEFEGKPAFVKEKVNINKPIQDTLAIVGHQLVLDNIGLDIHLDENLPPVIAHNNRLAQVIFNIVNNACDAINKNRTDRNVITIRSFQEHDSVAVTISDTGVGIPAHLRDRIFEPFFTTKEIGKGKGLGLSITNEVVRDYRGNVTVRSKKGQGTTFKLAFPIHSEALKTSE
ncbi:MAG: MMPL family transporter [Desulfobacteraceae bacterium]|nr:MMPL family transporter [Desulfobacteraceae bacterium]